MLTKKDLHELRAQLYLASQPRVNDDRTTSYRLFGPRQLPEAHLSSDMQTNAPVTWHELAALVVCIAAFTAFLLPYSFAGVLSEYDSYMVAAGLWHGYETGAGVTDMNLYGNWVSFGYDYFCYWVAGSTGFPDRDAVFASMNTIGFWSSVVCLPALWLALRVNYGRAIAWVAVPLYILSPVVLDIAGGAHPIVPASALMFLGAASLWTPAHGPVALALRLNASLLLAAALTFRFDVVFAFPLLVLAQRDPLPWRDFILICCRRLAPTVSAICLFFLARHLVFSGTTAKSAEFVATWYRWRNVPKGFIALSLAVGLGSAPLAAWALLAWLRRYFQLGSQPARLQECIPLLGPFAAICVGLAFWLPNPFPARHFAFLTLGVSLLTAICAVRLPLSSTRLATLTLMALIVNQVLSAGFAPALLKISGNDKIRPWPYLIGAPSGDIWSRRAMFKTIWTRALQVGDAVALNACDDELVVFTYWRPVIATSFLRNGWHPEFSYSSMTDIPLYTEIDLGARRIVLVSRSAPGAPNPAEMVLRDPRYAGYRFMVDGDSLEVGDHIEVPPEQAARMDCDRR